MRNDKIPPDIVQFLDRAMVGVAASRDSNLVPRVHRLSGWHLEEDGETMRCLIPGEYTGGLIENLKDNDRFTATIEEMGSHITYQFKGSYVDSQAPDAGDEATYESVRARLGEGAHRIFGLPVELGSTYQRPPGLTVRFRVEEIFIQTPGPDAGKRVVPQEESADAVL